LASDEEVKLMDLPGMPSEWTFDTVLGVARKYEYEPSLFDYKAVLAPSRMDSTKNEYMASIRRTVCSMANGDGGFILFGVRDREQSVGSPDERIIGIPFEGDLRKIFSEKISTLQRPVYFDASPQCIPLPNNPQRGIFIVYIPQSQLRPHMDVSTGAFYRRGEGGKADKMNFYEVHEQMMYTEERLRKVILFRLKIAQYIQQIATLRSLDDRITNALLRFDTNAFEIILSDICGFIPPVLLPNLLEIPAYARLVNEFLERATYPGMTLIAEGAAHPNSERKRAILENLTTFEGLCNHCDQRLEEIFGPLGEM
jgi:hypothetical protein